ncbi:related to inositol polyphosphate phosphatase-Laccaria bicolor [Serendipita indica DSM 11827]|uniref:Related to inositol polyphosphate phosphatase-Laccaria bicolor n=1 Tax=Serendipita indica (strain DSM 11827) TaxID=1109443 RepID=G4TPR2_SERID|nr:related to inositol polyphosphate phosphatase-Laccaria bicolor [Serendipita indica DSM 11827]
MLNNRVTVQIGTYNANLQGHEGLPQNLVDWLVPSLKVSSFLANMRTAPDIVAIGFQELLPLQFGFTGLSQAVMRSRDELIRSQLEHHAPNKERYSLVAKSVNVGIALLVYARDDTVAKHVTEVQTQWTGCGPGWMGNKGAVGIRFKVSSALYGGGDGPGEVYTFVNAHLTAHLTHLQQRIADYQHIVQTLLFSDPSETSKHANMYQTTHLFFFGDLNFRIEPPVSIARERLEAMVRTEEGRDELRQFDQLSLVRNQAKALVGLREGDFWKFQCTYKYKHGQIDQYHPKRTPSWTDRILFTTVSDDANNLSTSQITPLVYSAVPSYVASDHKPVVALLQLPAPSTTTTASLAPFLPTPVQYVNDPGWIWKRYIGKLLGWIVGWTWCLFWFVGAGNAVVGVAGSFAR